MVYIKHAPDGKDMAILTELKKYPPATMREIAATLGLSKTNIRRRMLWLEERGYIRQAGKARSQRSKVLTEKGFEYLHEPQ
jgi:DNA-binding Lrp family transcriptional regulator